MGEFAIKVEGLSKKYRIGERETSYRTLRDTLAAPFRLNRKRSLFQTTNDGQQPQSKNGHSTFWALKDISFEVKAGEVVGIIGRNGAGKSTLLKVLSRITEPTAGYADIKGRVGSLLEVGTGFHLELTGRENIFLSGAILGMKRSELKRKLDEMVAFAEVETFLDTPVKHYSSGMYLRLAFAVAAHSEPEILLIDEVLAVGDLVFQKKCLGKMGEVAAEGRTVLFVSHNMGAIKELCNSCIVLKNGVLDFRGSVSDGLLRYSRNLGQTEAKETIANMRGWENINIRNQSNGTSGQIASGASFVVEADLVLPVDITGARFYCLISDPNGTGVAHNFTDFGDLKIRELRAGRYRIRAEVPALWLIPNIYTLHFKLICETNAGSEERYESARIMLDITDGTKQSTGKIRAMLIPPINWTLDAAEPIGSFHREPIPHIEQGTSV